MMHKNILLPIIVSLMFFSGCIENKNNKLEQQINELNKRIDSLNSEIKLLEFEQFLLKRSFNAFKNVVLNLSAKGYQRVNTDNGYFLLIVEDVMPYLDGYKLILAIGNPSSATYKGFKLKVKWGRKFDVNMVGKFEEWKKSLQEKEESFTEQLRPASWNEIELIITPATPEQLKYVELSMETDVISLKEPLHTQVGQEVKEPNALTLREEIDRAITLGEQIDRAIGLGLLTENKLNKKEIEALSAYRKSAPPPTPQVEEMTE